MAEYLILRKPAQGPGDPGIQEPISRTITNFGVCCSHWRSSLLENRGLRTSVAGIFVFTAILATSPLTLSGQWLNVPANAPKTRGGKPNLGARAPRRPDGKPDLSGIWFGDEANKKYADLAADFKAGEFRIQPWAEALSKERITRGLAWPPAHCLPPSVPMLNAGASVQPLKIIQEPGLMVILYESFGLVRQMFLDGRTLAKDPNPTWLGYSVGRWEGDVLVVETTGFNDKTWLDLYGHPSTEALHITERFRRRDFGHLDLQVTIDDPKAYTKPWTVAVPLHLFPDGDLLEFVCNENEKDASHMVDK